MPRQQMQQFEVGMLHRASPDRSFLSADFKSVPARPGCAETRCMAGMVLV
jgi:hypothetical protein